MNINRSKPIYYKQALREISEGRINPCYLMYGEEFYLAETLTKQICEKFLGKADPELNYFSRYGTESGADTVLGLGAGMGLFSDKKLIVIKEAQALKMADVDKIFKFLEKQPPEIRIIFQTGEISIQKTRLKKLIPYGTLINLLPLREQELNQFIRAEFEKHHKEISREAVDLLVFHIGARIADLITQINTISQFYHNKSALGLTEIEEITSTYVTQTVFEYCAYVGNKSARESFSVLHKLVDSGISAQQIISQLLWHFLRLWQIQGYYRSGVRNNEKIARELNIFPKYFQDYANQAKKWPAAKILKLLELLQKADVTLKSGSGKAKIDLDILNHQILN